LRQAAEDPQLVAERQHGGAGGESRREDESFDPELDTPRQCGDDPRGDLENELVDAKTVYREALDVRVDVDAASDCAPLAPMRLSPPSRL
jgi:hypothetical protein